MVGVTGRCERNLENSKDLPCLEFTCVAYILPSGHVPLTAPELEMQQDPYPQTAYSSVHKCEKGSAWVSELHIEICAAKSFGHQRERERENSLVKHSQVICLWLKTWNSVYAVGVMPKVTYISYI